jgi:hypothetical protein
MTEIGALSVIQRFNCCPYEIWAALIPTETRSCSLFLNHRSKDGLRMKQQNVTASW